MLFFIRRVRASSIRSAWSSKVTGESSPVLHNLKFSSKVDPVKYISITKKEFSLPDGSMKKFIKFVETEVDKGHSSDSEIISEYGYDEVSRLLKSRSEVEESMRSLEDLVNQDPEMKKLGEEEYSSYADELESLDEELLNCLLQNMGKESCNDVILELKIGAGGQEAMLFAKDLLEMYMGYLDYLGFSHEVIHQDSLVTTSGAGGIRNASIAISGDRALEVLRHEAGVHRVQRIPETEKSGRMHTSTVSVMIIPQPTDIEVNIEDKDLRIETKRASGAGGQHVNTTDSAVRITHLPTGISVESQSDRSQIKNRRIALLRLRTIIYEKQLNEQRETSTKLRKKQMGLGNRNEKIRTYNFNQDRITDHRISDGTMHNLKRFLEGGCDLEELQIKLQKALQMKMLQDIVRKVINEK
ncbi:peptide chain release factor 1-like, mitochondrial [Venturia canescens]|uniref:peptide chain release factor 1-like, mitochondrial n=1 Tax=Venturia canescens TaxID=32260 RepID=UPI001C9BE34A|nr:peptide chain release factor 1-like, mitochondrial [Venturia canescens]